MDEPVGLALWLRRLNGTRPVLVSLLEPGQAHLLLCGSGLHLSGIRLHGAVPLTGGSLQLGQGLVPLCSQHGFLRDLLLHESLHLLLRLVLGLADNCELVGF